MTGSERPYSQTAWELFGTLPYNSCLVNVHNFVTHFNIGDTVYFVQNNLLHVSSIRFFLEDSEQIVTTGKQPFYLVKNSLIKYKSNKKSHP